jgi:hypothetical protein
MRIVAVLALLLTLLPARADLPTFEDFFRGVSECSLEMARYRTMVDASDDGILIALPAGGAVRGLVVTSFCFSPGRGGNGLLFNAPFESVVRSFPELAGKHTVNGHLRQLLRLSDETGEDGGRRKTLVMCTDGNNGLTGAVDGMVNRL